MSAKRRATRSLWGIALLAVLVGLATAGCGGGGSVSTASFCSDMQKFQTDYASLAAAYTGASGPPASKALIDRGASALQKLANEAPSGIKAATQTEAGAVSQWGKNGVDTALRTPAFRSADAKLAAWQKANCK